jgi:arylsulfatase A-like enzyme
MGYMAQEAGMTEVIGPAQLGGPAASSWGTEDGVLVDGLIRWIDVDPKRPFYAVAWTDQTHDPYTLDADTQPVEFPLAGDLHNRESLGRYLNAVRQADRHLGRLFAALRARGLAEDTLVVITGDHGEAFGELHDVMGHGGGLFDECLRVPLMLWNPRLFPTARRESRTGAHVDLNPTLAHLMGIRPPDGWQGASLFSPDHPGRAYLIADRSGYQFGVTDGQYKQIIRVSEGTDRLFDLLADPREETDVTGAHKEIARRLRGRISAFVHAEERYLAGKTPSR